MATILTSRKTLLDDAPLDIISNSWKHVVFDKDGRITKRGYTLCFLEKLQDSLRRRDIYVANSDRWSDPRAKLLQGLEWQSHRIQVYRSLGHTLNPEKAIDELAHQLDATYKQVATNLNENKTIKLDLSRKHPTLNIANLDKLGYQAHSCQNLRFVILMGVERTHCQFEVYLMLTSGEHRILCQFRVRKINY